MGLVGVVGLSGNEVLVRLEALDADGALHLDDVLALDYLSIARLEEGSGSGALRGGGKGQGEGGEDGGGTHYDGIKVVV